MSKSAEDHFQAKISASSFKKNLRKYFSAKYCHNYKLRCQPFTFRNVLHSFSNKSNLSSRKLPEESTSLKICRVPYSDEQPLPPFPITIRKAKRLFIRQ